MRKIWIASLGLLLALNAAVLAAPAKNGWENSLITLEATAKRYDYSQPWSKQTGKIQKNGIVLAGREILTTADGLNDVTLVRLQKSGRGQWYNAELKWIDYHANLALLTSAEDEFWAGLKPASLGANVRERDKTNLQIVRWRNGKIEARKAELTEYVVREGKLTFVPHVQMTLNSEVEGLGWAEAVVSGHDIVGLATSAIRNNCTATPTPFIRAVLQARAKNAFRGLGYFDFTWQSAENTAVLDYLGLPGKPRGVVIVEVPGRPGQTPALKRRDIILQVEGFPIDIQGDYEDPLYGPLMLENLSTRGGKWAGDKVRLKIWREGRELDVEYELPLADYYFENLPNEEFDRAPQYLLVGGLLFQPLSEPYLRRWGPDWRQRAPFRLLYYANEPKPRDRDEIVALSLVLPDPVNLGYQDYRYLVVDEVNGQKIRRLSQIPEALKQSKDGYHVFDFTDGSTPKRIVLDARETEAATRRVLQRYGIPKDHEFSEPLTKGLAPQLSSSP
ncbi:MAG: hypothetical protein AB1705_16980 [Verrucomicrobiota bacterium]